MDLLEHVFSLVSIAVSLSPPATKSDIDIDRVLFPTL